MLQKRAIQHIAFWVLYFLITLFNELFLTSDFINEFSLSLLLRTFASDLFLMLLKAGFTYLVLGYFLQRWLGSANRLRESLLTLMAVLAFVALYRLSIRYITWPYFLGIDPQFSLQSHIARYLYSLLEVLQILGITVTIKLLRLRVQTARQERDLLREKKSVELIRLRAQVQPHFLFNMLNSIYSLSRSEPQKTPEVVHKMSELLRFMLYESAKRLVSLQSELRIINDYIQMQQLRFNNRVAVQCDMDVDNEQAAITPLIIFPLVENAFKHGVGARADQPYIRLRISLKNNIMEAETRNAIMEHSVKDAESSGIGQPNIKKQLEILYRDHTFTYGAAGKEYHVYMRINLNSYVDFEMPGD